MDLLDLDTKITGWPLVFIVVLILVGIISMGFIVAGAPHPAVWHCIDGSEDVGFARMCEVDGCHVLFIGDEVLMECGR